MPLERAGFFRELRHGQATGPSLAESRGALAGATAEQVVRYLSSGSVLAATGSSTDDWFDPARRRIAPLATRTDGAWMWPDDLAYYVATYAVGLPEAFVRHMAKSAWTAPPLSYDQLVDLEGQLIGGPNEKEEAR